MKLQGNLADEPASATTPFGALVMFGGATKNDTVRFFTLNTFTLS